MLFCHPEQVINQCSMMEALAIYSNHPSVGVDYSLAVLDDDDASAHGRMQTPGLTPAVVHEG